MALQPRGQTRDEQGEAEKEEKTEQLVSNGLIPANPFNHTPFYFVP